MRHAHGVADDRQEKVRVIGVPRKPFGTGWNYIVACPRPENCSICKRSPNVS